MINIIWKFETMNMVIMACRIWEDNWYPMIVHHAPSHVSSSSNISTGPPLSSFLEPAPILLVTLKLTLLSSQGILVISNHPYPDKNQPFISPFQKAI